MPTYSSPATEVLVVADCWPAEADADAVIHRAIEAAAAMVDTDTADAELAIMLTDDAGIRTLNQNWRGIDKPTNVLSFPALQPPEGADEPDACRACWATSLLPTRPRAARPTTKRRASPTISAISPFTVFCIWSVTTMRRTTKPKRWKRWKREILATLGIPDPYADQDRVT